MKSRNLVLFIVLIFSLSLVVFCLCHSKGAQQKQFTYEWNIPQSIIERYTENDLVETKRRLEEKFGEIAGNISKNYAGNNFGAIGELLSTHNTAFYLNGETISGKEDIERFFRENGKHAFSMEPQIKIRCFDLERENVTRGGIDFLAIVRFNIGFASLTDDGLQNLDPPGDGIFFHRNICTWI